MEGQRSKKGVEGGEIVLLWWEKDQDEQGKVESLFLNLILIS